MIGRIRIEEVQQYMIRTGCLCGFSLGVRTEAQTKKRSSIASKSSLPAMSHCALLEWRTALVKYRWSVPLPPRPFDRSVTPDQLLDRPSTLFDDARASFPQLASAYISGLTPACPPIIMSMECSFYAQGARYMFDHYSQPGGLLPAFAACRRAGRRETGKQAVGIVSFM